jgi:5'-nucleotidase / UDP-sugar diphosphatase
VNSGSIRGDRVYPAGAITRRTIVALHPFDNVVCKIAVPGSVIVEALNNGVSKYPAAAGGFPQVSGLAFTIDSSAPAGQRVIDARIGDQRLDPQKIYTLAIPDFIFKGGDGYTMLSAGEVLVSPEAGNLIVGALERYIAARGTIAPRVNGRIVIR